MYILGINAYHGDSAACLLHGGQVLAAAEEERFTRVKHCAGLPAQAVRYCLAEAGIGLAQVDYIAVSRRPWAKWPQKLLHAAGLALRQGLGGALAARLANARHLGDLRQGLAQALHVPPQTLKAKLVGVEHHLSHLASAFFASPFEQAALLSLDGFGDFSSTLLGTGRAGRIEPLHSIDFPHSCGVFYTAFTQWLGFAHYGDEYKVMGLAAYGQPKYTPRLLQVLQAKPQGRFALDMRFFNHQRQGVAMQWQGGAPLLGPLYSAHLVESFGPPRAPHAPIEQYHRDMAASVQQCCELLLFHLLNYLHQQTGLNRLCLAGGVAQNSVANGKIIRQTSFKELFVPPAAHDAGTAIGAALYLHHCQLGQARPQTVSESSPYLGPHYPQADIEALLTARGLPYRVLASHELPEQVAQLLAEGAVVGWFQGRMEFGPRALGNRSILADPRRPDARQWLNQKIKRREEFRPFAPTVLAEEAPNFFDMVQPSPFMEKVCQVHPHQRERIPAVTHANGTARVQTLTQAQNPRFYQLIAAFGRLTGVPMLLNTSFNEQEPIVNRPEEALDCFLRTQIDALVMENVLIERKCL